MELKIREEKKDNVVELHLEGEVDVYTAPHLKKKLYTLMKEGHSVVVSLEDVNYMDSTGLGVFIGALKQANSGKGSIQLRSLQPRIQRLFEITGLKEVMDIK